jgi:hypothetical protein
VKKITAELQAASSSDSKSFDPVERIKEGFVTFKKEKYEFVFSLHRFLFSDGKSLPLAVYSTPSLLSTSQTS